MNAKPLIQVGIAFILLGIVAFTYQDGADTSGDHPGQIWTVQAGADAMKALALSPLSAGALEGPTGLFTARHIYVADAADWESVAGESI